MPFIDLIKKEIASLSLIRSYLQNFDYFFLV